MGLTRIDGELFKKPVGIGTNLTISEEGNINTTGVITATQFVGDATGLTGVGLGTDININTTGIITASKFYGDISEATGAAAGLGTALSQDLNSPLNKIYFTDTTLHINSNTTVDVPESSMAAYTQYSEVAVSDTVDFIVSEGDDFIPDILGIGTETRGTMTGNGGRVRADNFSDRSGAGAPTFQTGLQVTGVATATSFDGNLTGDVTANQITVGDTFLKPQSIGIGTTTTVGRNAGVSTAIGTIIYNASVNQIQAYGPSGWVNVKSINPTGLTATGGIIKDYDDGINKYRSHIFNSSGTFEVTGLSDDFDNVIDYMVVAGGGAGGDDGPAGNCAGGGGAGGLYYSSAFNVSIQSYNVVIGAGGAMSSNPVNGNGGPSSFGTITMNGGGAGAAQNGDLPAQHGGSGGGAAYNTAGTTFGGNGTGNSNGTDGAVSPAIGFGNFGGIFGGQPSAAGAGGGGAGGIGQSVNYPGPGYSKGPGNKSGQGGVGLQYSITGISTYYAGGGGGHGYAQISPGGDGGGGSAHPTVVAARGDARGVRNTGGGGGGCSHPATTAGGGGRPSSGGSGVVIVRYKIGTSQTATAKATGGNVSFYNGKTIHAFTSTGTFTTPASFNETCEYVMIGAGGAGGSYTYRGGGGGAGTYKTGSTPVSGTNAINVTVGSGGAAFVSGYPSPAGNGNASSIAFPSTITAPGGGMGGSWDDRAATSGGSGGGAGGGPSAPGSNGGSSTGDPYPGTIGATPSNGWGHDGGHTEVNQQQGAGGGGAGQVGYPNAWSLSTSLRGFGGAGVQMPATFRNPAGTIGTPGPNPGGYYVGGGGNGGGYPPAGNPAVETTRPVGGGGYGVMDASLPPYGGAGGDGLDNTGSGGGGTNYGEPTSGDGSGIGGNGGSGIVLIAYPT